ncbi:pyridoxamine 5'-phosphate oxidase family protein [Maritimibacter sp. UBA3975]|uniref:pyridoxamine 5'-phosphate oxidase family protein n=1 Tax=Maritimibacter sp. UBA3975 TaxID=1946833 RepID=UPI000C0BA04A|nr:pyridoxamine 5'-phosphate oxidase family protein [Maritimibacter sp. UBA3975]MAM61686.1 pyridoxamine 5'-phosphate oxidase [Maritimibacter sp.]|tara:strand:+ start:13204 stop:13746 length:543 start_codon:yes stop_codon:yes gene_type:complete
MAKQFDTIAAPHKAFIEDQHLFFVGSAAREGRVNVSPKGMDSLRVMGPNRIVWLNLTGSGNETAGHLRDVNRMTLMWCSFTTRPLILRCYGTARTVHPRDADFAELAGLFGTPTGARQVYDMTVDLVQTSCGYAVPFFDEHRERDTLVTWAEDKGDDGIVAYWEEKNLKTIDGADTGIFE